MQILAPACESTCAATPPPAPEPTITTSYVLGVALIWGMKFKLIGTGTNRIREIAGAGETPTPACATHPMALERVSQTELELTLSIFVDNAAEVCAVRVRLETATR